MTDDAGGLLPLPPPVAKQPAVAVSSVWPTGQHDDVTQLRMRGYLPATETDIHRIPPGIAAHAIACYSRPGDTVLDPDCGAGTVLVEALRAGRHTVGLTTRCRWWRLARANLTAIKRAGAWPDGTVLDASSRILRTPHAAGLTGRVGLILTNLGHPSPTLTSEHNSHRRHGEPHTVLPRLVETLTASVPLLRPDGHVVIVIRRSRHHGALEDLPATVLAAGVAAGLIPRQRCVALLAPLRGTRLVTRAWFAQRQAVDRAHAAGTPIMLVAHHDVLVFGAPEPVEQLAAGTEAPKAVVATATLKSGHGTNRDIATDWRGQRSAA